MFNKEMPASIVFHSILFMLLISACSFIALGQNRFEAIVVDSTSKAPIPGANAVVVGTGLGGASDTAGNVFISGIPDGTQRISISCVGYRSRELQFAFPLPAPARRIEIALVRSDVTLNEVTVTTARTSYHLSNAPMRIEVKGEEDIGETMIDHPSSISELFLESTGIQLLRTSPVSNYVSIRLQGLDGSYTQILKDGFPLYGGLSAGLSVTQIPPLDLGRVEIVKGPSSSLYGAGAMAGIINLISKKPAENKQLTMLLSGASSQGIDGGMLYSGRRDKLGYTLLLNGNLNKAYDADGSGFSDIPKRRLITVNPKLFYDLDDKTKMSFGLSTTAENLSSGDLTAVDEGASAVHPYVENTRSNRSYTQFEATTSLRNLSIDFKNSIGYFSLDRSLESMRFAGTQWSSYSEVSAQMTSGNHTLTGGLSVATDRFLEDARDNVNRSYSQATAGFFAQDDWRLASSLTVETGGRIDWDNRYGVHFVPRIAGIYRVNDELSFRTSVGTGYKAPTIFSDQSDPDILYHLNPIGSAVRVETSAGGEFDMTYSAILFGTVTVTLNQAVFYTRVNDPLVVDTTATTGAKTFLRNAAGSLSSAGAETDVKLTLDELEAFIGYTYTNARNRFPNSNAEPFLTPRHKFVTDVVFDMEEGGNAGLELRYTGPQLLHDATRSPGYWIVDCLFQKTFAPLTVFVGVENALNYKEADYSSVVTGGSINPVFNDVWAPLEGRTVNIGLKFQM